MILPLMLPQYLMGYHGFMCEPFLASENRKFLAIINNTGYFSAMFLNCIMSVISDNTPRSIVYVDYCYQV